MATVVFTSLDQIKIDGQNAGNIVDVISNHAPLRADVLAAYNVFLAKLNSDHARALQAVQSNLATKTSELTTATEAKTTLEAQVATLTSENHELRADIVDIEQALGTEHQFTATLQAKVKYLEQYRPYDKRILSGKAFYKRISQEDMETLLASEIPHLVEAGKTILAFRDNPWPVMLDSADFQRLVQGVIESGVFDESEVTEIMRDATREEAFGSVLE